MIRTCRAAGMRRALALVALLGSIAAAAPLYAEDSLFTVSNISVDVTAKNAVAAKDKAMSQAQARAFQIVLKRLVPDSLYPKLAALSQQDVEDLVDNVSVDSEQMSTTRYIATLDVTFNSKAVRQLLASYSLASSEKRAPELTIVPLVLSGDSVAPDGSEGWHEAWSGVDLNHGVLPARLLPPRPELDAAKVKSILAGDKDGLVWLQNAYGEQDLVLAVGQAQSGTFVTRIVGADAIGPINYGRSSKIAGSDAKGAAQEAASFAFSVLENRWKLMQAGQKTPGEARAPDNPEGAAQTTPAEVPRNVVADVEFSGLKDWQDIRQKLMNVPGVQALEVNSLSARAASITFDYAGSLGHLQKALQDNGFDFENREDSFVLRLR